MVCGLSTRAPEGRDGRHTSLKRERGDRLGRRVWQAMPIDPRLCVGLVFQDIRDTRDTYEGRYVDGSAQFTKSSIAKATWQAPGTRAGGEVVSSDSY